MKNKKINSKLDIGTSHKLLQFVGNWFVLLGILLCLTTFHVTAEEAPDTEKKDAEAIQETEQTPVAPPDNTENDLTTPSDQQGDKTDTDEVEVTKEVITGTSDRMDRDEKVGITILIGNVKTKRHSEDGVEIGFLNADTVTLKSNPETGETVEIIAVGNVEIRDDKIFATCDHATLDNLTGIITLKDNVVVLQKNDRLETKLFTFNRVTGKQTGVGDVKFKVTVTQATPTAPAESEETDSDGTDSSNEPDSGEDKVESPEPEKKDEKESETDSDKTDSKVDAAQKESEKVKEETETEESEQVESEDTEEAETEETEETETEDTDTEDTGEEETQD